MTKTKREFQRAGRYDDTLLRQGKYREWFYDGLSPEAKSYLNSQPRITYSWTCVTCKEQKPVHQFSKCERTRYRQCNACILASSRGVTEQDALRWENKHDRKHWMDKAACLDAPDPEIFFPKTTSAYLDENAEWRKYCPGCPIRELCIEQIKTSTQIPQGIFGGHYFAISIGEVTTDTANPVGRPRKGKG